MINVSFVVNSFFSSRTYLIEAQKSIFLIDCGDIESFCDMADSISAVLLTHSHFDHIYGLNDLLHIWPDVKVFTNDYGRQMLLNPQKNMSTYHDKPFTFLHHDNIVIVEDGEELEITDGITAKAIFTPGHNQSCITWHIDDCLFTGDALIPGLKTVTKLPGGDKDKARESELKINKLLSEFNLKICPGH